MTALDALPTFADADSVHVVVESPRGSTSKFKYDPHHRVVMLHRPLPSGLAYPHDWGFVASTRAEDGDPLDAFLLWDGVSYPGVVIPSRPIGVLRVEQTNLTSHQRERNDRVAMLPVKAPRLNGLRNVLDLNERVRVELELFFLGAAVLEGKAPTVVGWGDPAEAMALVRSTMVEREVGHE